MKEDRILELKLQGILALLFFIGGGNLFSQSGTQFPINDPRNPNCPCHKAQKLADQEFKNLLANANVPHNQINNLKEQKTNTNRNVIHSNKNMNDGGISQAENEKQKQQLFANGDLSNKNILDEGISEAEQENNNTLGNESGNDFQLVNAQINFVPQNVNPIDQGVSNADNEINKFIVLSNDINFFDNQQSSSQQNFSSNRSSGSSKGFSSGSTFKHKRTEGHTKYKHHILSHRYAKFIRRIDCHNWHFLKEAKKIASCYHWS